MQKIKLFMILALLVVGVSGAWAGTASRYYDVTYEGLTVAQGAGYTINRAFDDFWNTEGINEESSTQVLIVMTNSQTWGTPSVTTLTTSNYSTYFSPKEVTDYTVSVTSITAPSGNTHGKITIKYVPSFILSADGVLKFKVTGNNTVSVALNLNKTTQVTDTITTTSKLWNHTTHYTGETGWSGETSTDGSISYTYIGDRFDTKNGNSSIHYSYQRTHTVAYSDVTDVTIPATVTDANGKVYNVTSIADQGFVYEQAYQFERPICSSGENVSTVNCLTMEARNDYLKTVRFAEGCQITSIGQYAFISCTQLESIVIPKTVVTINKGAFECCVALATLQFQTETNKTSDLRTIGEFVFYGCESFDTVDLPEGLTSIGQYAFTYNFSLVNITLPNTLKTIGAHFLCCASSLQTLVIPASVETIDGAFFHGCESLDEVYLLGTAASLNAKDNDGNNTFGYNNYFCKGAVSGCKFYTTSDYISSYAGHSAWALIADNRDESSGYLVDEEGNLIKNSNNQNVSPVGTNQNNGNKLLVIKPITQKFAYKWVTACFPQGLENYKDASKLGPDAMVAEMVAAEAVGGDPYVYHLTFRLISGNDITAGRPYLVCPSEQSIENDITITDAVWQNQHKDEMTKLHSYYVTANNGAIVYMNSYYTERQLQVGDFYFASSGEVGPNKKVGSFWKVTNATTAPKMKACKCYWDISLDGVTDLSQAKMAMASNLWDETDGIEGTEQPEAKIVIDGIYDLNGNKLDLDYDALVKGLYIVNGKKVVKK